MKKIILLGAIILLSGCKDSETNLNKNIINYAYTYCKDSLTNELKSPSSLKIISADIHQMKPDPEQIYLSYGKDMIENGKISDYYIKEKYRFRILGIKIDYEAKNSFGVMLKNQYICSYIYSLYGDNKGPDSMYLTMLKNNKDEVYPYSMVANFDSASNYFLNNDIKYKTKSAESSFSKNDREIFNELIKIDQDKINEQEAERLRRSWESNSTSEFSGANLSGI